MGTGLLEGDGRAAGPTTGRRDPPQCTGVHTVQSKPIPVRTGAGEGPGPRESGGTARHPSRSTHSP
ncbi:hypothetical protein FM103_17345 [Corynebacterium xerosis]|nr:hypothetical protein FM103_17345 [Corynebacterium xerosis]